MSLSGKVALITGGGKNLGADIAKELAALGANLALHYNSPGSKAESVKTEQALTKAYPNIKVRLYQGNLSTAGAVEGLFAEVLKDFGKLDIVVNTVGKVLKKPIVDISEEEYDAMFE